jgi:hypothetical protein
MIVDMAKPPDPSADPKFLETVRRMLKTPPQPRPKRERDKSVPPKGKRAKKTPAK